MPLHPEMVKILAALVDQPPLDQLPLQAFRASMAPLPPALRTPVGGVRDIRVPGLVPMRFYRPHLKAGDELILFFHGGGFVLGSIETHDNVARDLCSTTGRPVLSVDYRLAPEHPFPAASEDCLAAFLWAVENADSLAARRERIVLCGDSAGGNLAVVTALRLRDNGHPAALGQILAYPVTDFHTPPTRSYLDNGAGYSLTRAMMIRFLDYYLPSGQAWDHPYVAPLRAKSLAGLPASLILTAEYDPLRDEGAAFATKLAADGAPVAHIDYDGLIHGFLRMGAVSPRARATFDDISGWIDRLPHAQ